MPVNVKCWKSFAFVLLLAACLISCSERTELVSADLDPVEDPEPVDHFWQKIDTDSAHVSDGSRGFYRSAYSTNDL
jgi:hypothetical protein